MIDLGNDPRMTNGDILGLCIIFVCFLGFFTDIIAQELRRIADILERNKK